MRFNNKLIQHSNYQKNIELLDSADGDDLKDDIDEIFIKDRSEELIENY